MALNELPLAQGTLYRDFETEVLASLVKHDAKMHGCPVTRVECKLDGGVAIWFKGPRPGVGEWEGALRFNFPLLRDKKWLGNTDAVTEVTLELLANIAAKEQQPIIQRAH